jgi:hypothetical protein
MTRSGANGIFDRINKIYKITASAMDPRKNTNGNQWAASQCRGRESNLVNLVNPVKTPLTFSVVLSVACLAAVAQTPKISTLFPIGGKAGTTVEVEVRGSSLAGAERLVVSGKGVSGTVQPGDAKVDEKFKPLFQSKCSGCHELRSPANRSMTPAQWAATVDRMVRVRNAPLSATEAANVTEYLQSMAKAGKLTAEVKIAPDAQPGLVELRVANPKGVSTACLFEVGNLPEVMGQNGALDTAQAVGLPCVANGTLAGNAERHYYKFAAKQGQRLVFNLKGYRYDDRTQMFFNPDLRLYDAKGTEIAENHGYYDLDPLIDWKCPADGDYRLEVRDLLGRGNPGSVYRLAMGPVPYDTFAYPPAIQAKTKANLLVSGKNLSGMRCNVDAPDTTGITQVGTPYGGQSVCVTPYPVAQPSAADKPVTLPAGFAGRLDKLGGAVNYALQGNGAFEFEVYASRLGAPETAVAQLLDAKGSAVARANGDSRMAANLQQGQAYTLRVESGDGKFGPDCTFFVEARPRRPLLACVVRPDTFTVKPGMTTAVEVRVTARDGVEGDIQVSAEGLPEGVTAAPALLQPDRQSVWLQFTATSSVKPGEQPIRIVAKAHGSSGETMVTAVPQEMYLMNNSPRYFDRAECVLAVRAAPDFTAEIESPGPIKVHALKAMPVKVRVKRAESFKGPVVVRIEGLPSGWIASPETIGPNQTEATLQVRPDGNNRTPFIKRDPKLSPIIAVITVEADEYPFVAGTAMIEKADRIEDEKEDGN